MYNESRGKNIGFIHFRFCFIDNKQRTNTLEIKIKKHIMRGLKAKPDICKISNLLGQLKNV